MEKFKYFFIDKSNIVASFALFLAWLGITIYGIFTIVWFITSIIVPIVIAAIIATSNKSYKNYKDLKDKGYNV